jgi:methyl-accepting chemotaxis protein
MGMRRFRTGRDFRQWTYTTTASFAAAALVFAMLYIWPIMRPPEGHVPLILGIALVGLAVGWSGAVLSAERWVRPIAHWIDAEEAGHATREDVRAAFAVVIDFPLRIFMVGMSAWLIAGGLCVAAGTWIFPEMTGLRILGVAMAPALGGLSSQSFTMGWLQRGLTREREALAAAIDDPDERGRLVRRQPIGRELTLSFAGLCLLNAVYAICLVHVERSTSELERLTEFRTEVVAQVRGALEGAATPDAAIHALDALPELRRRDPTFVDVMRGQGVPLVISSVTLALLALFTAGSLVETAHALREEVDRLATGDLRSERCVESPNEFGDLARAFSRMASMLRLTVLRYAETARGMEGVTEKIAGAASSVTSATKSQVANLGEASRSMDNLRVHMEGISNSTQALSASMESHSQHVSPLVSSGQDLHHNASILTMHVKETSRRIDSLIESSDRISQRGEGLGQRATTAAASLERVAEAARTVDANSSELARLAERTIGAAEQGRERVRRTGAGMEAIRVATETADNVIRGLGERARQIGRIVDVIDDVADETSLLALNAAIIAAQAGSAGSAFKVVADEVRSLADRVLKSTKEIAEVVTAVQDESSRAVEAIARGVESVREGVTLSNEAGASLEEIAAAANASGARIQQITQETSRQVEAVAEVVALMDDVRSGVDEIQEMGREQSATSRAVLESSGTMEGVASEVHATAERQSRSVGQMRDGMEQMREATRAIRDALEEQSATSGALAGFLAQVLQDTRSHEISAEQMLQAVDALAKQAEALRRDVSQFKVA